MDVNDLLRYTVERGASDLHLKVGNVPFVRIDGQLTPGEFAELTASDTEIAAAALMSEHKKREFAETNEADLGYTLSGVGRFRVNVFRQRGSVAMIFRRVRTSATTVDDLGLPEVVTRLANEHRGLILVTGPTGSGKTTTLAAVIDHINRTRECHIVTIEDPIEVVHRDDMASINQ
ncbi:MAG: type IV pilus twitching motility protein PilT, partial [Actinomycetota bacterium]